MMYLPVSHSWLNERKHCNYVVSINADECACVYCESRIVSLLYRLYDDEINCLLQRDLEKLRADLQMKDRELRSVTSEREHIQQSAAAAERAVKSH